MPEGALLTNTVEAALTDLAASRATGCLVVRDQEGDEAEVYLRDGEVYSVMVPGRRVMLGVRLMSSGALTPEALAEALEIQRTELQGWRLGELLVHLGYVELSVVEEFVVEHLKDALADLFGWPVSAWKFRKNKKTRQDIAPPTSVAVLLDDLRDRAMTWEQILAAIGGPDSVPVLDSGTPSDEVPLGPNEWALLCKVDAERTVADLAAECGFTLFEAGQVVSRLTEAGLVAVPGAPIEAAEEVTDAPVTDAPVTDAPVTGAEVPAEVEVEDVAVPEPLDETGSELVLPMVDIAQAEAREADEVAQAAAEQAEADHAEAVRVASENKRLREAEILHKELEALAAREAAARQGRAAARQKAREDEAERARAAEGEAERLAAEEQAWADHAAWTTDERLRAETAAWAEHAERLAAERAAAEEPAWADHADWLAQQRRAVEAQAWADHADWTAAREAAEAAAARLAAEAEAQAARLAAEAEAERHRLAAEAEAERERLAAQAEAERQAAAREQAERELAAEAERRAQEQAERAAAAAAEQIARADAERREREEAERLAAEAAEAIAADEAAKVAAEHEAEVRRQAALELARFTAQEQERQAAAAQAQAAAEQEQAARAAAQRAAEQSSTGPDHRTDADVDVAAGAARAAQAASMLTELNRDVPAPRAARDSGPIPAVPPVPAPEAAPATEHVDDTPEPLVQRDQADTAMLLRELSSLGFGGEDDRPSTPPSPPVHRPSSAGYDSKKKRKGLFGRG